MIDKPHHPLPQSKEARHDAIPESLERKKGRGEDQREPTRPSTAANPDGETYPTDEHLP